MSGTSCKADSLAFKIFLANTLSYEGGYTNDARDPGNWTSGTAGRGQNLGTNWGISTASYPFILAGLTSACRATMPASVKGLSRDQAAVIYKAEFWDGVGGDTFPPSLGILVSDCAVNSGKGGAIRLLQQTLGVEADGQLGAGTYGAVEAHARVDLLGLCTDFQVRHLQYLMALAIWPTYGRGWLRRAIGVSLQAGRMLDAPSITAS